MTARLIRGRVLTFAACPAGPGDEDAFDYFEDGAILVRDGQITACGEAGEIDAGDAEVVDHRPCLLIPGLIDTHLHFPQVQVIASFGRRLLEWLNTYTFPAEARFADAAHAARIARAFFDETLRHGTTTTAAYCSSHPGSADAYFAEAERRNLRVIGGKVMMDRNAPAGVLDTAQSAYDDTVGLIGRWHRKGRALYAITPRFAITSTPEQLDAAWSLAVEHPDCHIQTHLAETPEEIGLTAELYPDEPDYFAVYERYGLAGPRSLFGHCLHLTPRERGAMAETGSVAVFCPTSNLFLGSGLFDAEGLAADGVRMAIATDIGGGTSFSMLRTLDEGYKVLQLGGQVMDPLRAFWWATRGNAEALGLVHRIGTLAPGTEADIAVLDARATPLMALRMETVSTLAEELFVLQTLGDDRAVREVYVAGEPSRPA